MKEIEDRLNRMWDEFLCKMYSDAIRVHLIDYTRKKTFCLFIVKDQLYLTNFFTTACVFTNFFSWMTNVCDKYRNDVVDINHQMTYINDLH